MNPLSVARFEAEGYLVVPGLITGAELRALDQLADRTLDGELK